MLGLLKKLFGGKPQEAEKQTEQVATPAVEVAPYKIETPPAVEPAPVQVEVKPVETKVKNTKEKAKPAVKSAVKPKTGGRGRKPKAKTAQ